MNAPGWLGLLKWSLAQSDGTAPSEVTPMTADDKAFLERVMKECVKDEPARMNEIMKEFVKYLEDGTAQDNKDKIEQNLEELKDMVDQIDMAQVFVKFGGLECLLQFVELESLAGDVRGIAASVIGTIAQNNILVQDTIYKKGAMDRLARVFLGNDSFSLCAKVLFAISGVVRSHAAAEEDFSRYATQIFKKSMITESPVLMRRAFYFGSALLSSDCSHPNRAQQLADCFVPKCFEYIVSEEIDLREGCIALVGSLITSKGTDGKSILTSQQSNLELILNERSLALQNSISSEQSSNVDQDLHEIQLIQNLREMFVEASQASPSQEPVLMLGP